MAGANGWCCKKGVGYIRSPLSKAGEPFREPLLLSSREFSFVPHCHAISYWILNSWLLGRGYVSIRSDSVDAGSS